MKTELLVLEKYKKKYQATKDELVNSMKKEKQLKRELAHEKKIVRKWMDSGKTSRKIVVEHGDKTILNEKTQGKLPIIEALTTDDETYKIINLYKER